MKDVVRRGYLYQEYNLGFANFEKNRYFCKEQECTNIYAAISNSGNVILVNPDTHVLAAVTSYFKPTVFDRVDFIEEVLLPTVG